MPCVCPSTLQLLSGPSGARSRDVNSKRYKRKQRGQPQAVPVKTESPQGQVRIQISRHNRGNRSNNKFCL